MIRHGQTVQTLVMNNPCCSRCGSQRACPCRGRRTGVTNAAVDLTRLAKDLGVRADPKTQPVEFTRELNAAVERLMQYLAGSGELPDDGTPDADMAEADLGAVANWRRSKDDSANLLPVFNVNWDAMASPALTGRREVRTAAPAHRPKREVDNLLPTDPGIDWNAMASPALVRRRA